MEFLLKKRILFLFITIDRRLGRAVVTVVGRGVPYRIRNRYPKSKTVFLVF